MGQISAKTVLSAVLLLTAAGCGASPEPDSATQLSSEATQVRVDDLGDGRSNNQELETAEETGDRTWATPSAILAAMATPVDISTPEGVTIDSVSTTVSRDETRRETLAIEIVTSSELEPLELACLLEREPPIPAAENESQDQLDCEALDPDLLWLSHGTPDIELPTYGSFYGWDSLDTHIIEPGTAQNPGPNTLAITTLGTRRQSQDAGDNLHQLELAKPIRELMAKIPQSSASTSRITWRPDTPDQISAIIYLSSLPETGDEVVAWMRARATPDSYAFDDATASATLIGQPPVEMTWRAGSSRNGGSVSFDYPLDENGQPLTNPSIADEPIWSDLIAWGDEWTFDVDGIEDIGWTTIDFNDSDWSIGDAPFVRDDPGAATDFATPAPGTTGWLRSSFTISDPSTIERLDLEAVVDDGFVVYLNGIEIHRWNLPDGPLTAETLTVERISGDDELVVRHQTDLLTEALVAGENVIAVAIHQGAPDSSDLRFDLRLAATKRLDL